MTEEVDYIYNIPKFSKKASLENTRYMLTKLNAFCSKSKIIHVAGTNGKGSVCAYLESIIRNAGHTVGLFTSPHLVRINERIKINGEDISDEDFERIFSKVKSVSKNMMDEGYIHPSFFEFLFGMGMLAFSEVEPEYIILETGLGGRLDATNAVLKKNITIITSIGLDHTDILGDTLEQIAYEKAGIIRDGVPVVFSNTQEKVTGVISKAAMENNSPMCILNPEDIKNISYEHKKIDFLLDNEYYCNVCVTVSSVATYQVENASLAAIAAHKLGFSDEQVVYGINHTSWIGRMQEVSSNFFIDGGHNDAGIAEFIDTVNKNDSVKPVTLLFSAVKDKHYDTMIEKLCASQLFDRFVLCQLNDTRGLDIEAMRKCFENNTNKEVIAFRNLTEAMTYISHNQEGTIYSVGSLYLVGEILALLEKREK